MSTTNGDLAGYEAGLGIGGGYAKSAADMDKYIKDINKKNKETTSRYNELIKKPIIKDKNRDGVVRRVNPQGK
jgi:hypothetical protein